MDYMQMTEPLSLEQMLEATLYVFFCAFVVITIFALMFKVVLSVTDFCEELRYLNMEIERTEGEERGYYIYLRRRLWLSLIPFVRY